MKRVTHGQVVSNQFELKSVATHKWRAKKAKDKNATSTAPRG
jgi:hypothetical protein